jgi:deoxycytidylate deaminase
VIVDQQNRPISFGYNGNIAGGDDEYFSYERPQKYYTIIHAEMNAILFAKRDLSNSKMFVTYASCENCLKFIIQAGIKEVIYERPIVNSGIHKSAHGMTHSEGREAATRLIMAAKKIGFSMRNINGTPYLEELR